METTCEHCGETLTSGTRLTSEGIWMRPEGVIKHYVLFANDGNPGYRPNSESEVLIACTDRRAVEKAVDLIRKKLEAYEKGISDGIEEDDPPYIAHWELYEVKDPWWNEEAGHLWSVTGPCLATPDYLQAVLDAWTSEG